jgi:hypothetical protein
MADDENQTQGGAGGGDRLTIEMWAERKGMLPQQLEGPGGRPRPNPDYWKFAAARAFKGWAEGAVVTEEEFDTAVSQQGAQVIR